MENQKVILVPSHPINIDIDIDSKTLLKRRNIKPTSTSYIHDPAPTKTSAENCSKPIYLRQQVKSKRSHSWQLQQQQLQQLQNRQSQSTYSNQYDSPIANRSQTAENNFLRKSYF